ncbi:MAG: SGNH hydrolase-type esterase domain-containing protein [Benniella sp.]|nr:MAG: SGNH hydrolase-type esterase domain-containing protein [Benniella sp.]
MDHLKSLSRSCHVFWTVCFFYIKLAFIYLARWYEPALRTQGHYNHTIIILGDDHALGVGGYSTLTGGSGIVPKLAKELAKETSVRQSWQIYNRGEYRTSTEDWLLSADSKRLEKPKLLNRVFQDPKYQMADIVIVMLGSCDVLEKNPSLTPQETLRNLQWICQAIQKNGKNGKSIYLCTIPTAGDDLYLTDQQRADNVTRNSLIEEYVKKNNDGVLPGLQMDLASNFEMRRGNLYWQDGRHFSDIGYTKMAKDWVPLIRPDMVKREFALYRADLGQ